MVTLDRGCSNVVQSTILGAGINRVQAKALGAAGAPSGYSGRFDLDNGPLFEFHGVVL